MAAMAPLSPDRRGIFEGGIRLRAGLHVIGWKLWRNFFGSYVQSARVGTAGSIEGARVTIICFLWVFFGAAPCFGNLLWRHAHIAQSIRAVCTPAINSGPGRRV